MNICAMASNVTVITTDDLDGSDDASPVTFALDGSAYEIDLASANRAKLEDALEPFIKAARRTRAVRNRSSVRAPRSADRGAVRAWAREAGLQIPERGRISGEILRQYDAAH